MVRIINQPIALRMGDIIKTSLANSGSFDCFYFIVAFAKKSGVSRIQEAMQSFKDNGGVIKGAIGIDSEGTSIQGLRLLLQLTDEVYIYHDKNPSRSFHPKIYIFEEEGEQAKVCIGSSNLTSGGLFTNYEIDVELIFNLADADDLQLFEEIKIIFEYYTDIENDCCKLLDETLLEQLIERNLLENEGVQPTSSEGGIGKMRLEDVESLFGTGSFVPAPSQYREPPEAEEEEERVMEEPTEEISAHDMWDLKGLLVWKKTNLPATDILYAKTSNTNPTGSLRFVKAGWKTDGKKIEQTTYFRYDVFGKLTWMVEKTKPFQEKTDVLFNVRILGKDKGQYRLIMRHKPSGEADQNNFTTALSWGELANVIRAFDLRGKDFYLYRTFRR